MTTATNSKPADSPFVRLRPFEVTGVLLLIWTIAGIVAVSAVNHGRMSLLPVYGAFVLYLTTLSLPIVMPGRDIGIFHPVLFYILCHSMLALLRSDAALASGMLEEHRALYMFDQAGLDLAVGKLFVLKTLSLVGLYCGYALMPYVRFRKIPMVRPKALRVKTLLLVGVSTVGVIVLASQAGGIGGLLMQRGIAAVDRVGADTGAHWHYLSGIATVAPVIWLAFYPRALRTPLFWLVALSSVTLIFLARGSRSNVLIVLIIMGMVWTIQARKVPYKVVLGGIVLSVMLIGALGEFRRATRHRDEITQVSVDTDVSDALESGLEDLSQRGIHDNGQLAVIARVPSHVGYLYGRSYFSIPFIVIPSALIGPKPPPAGRLNAQLVHGRIDTGIPAGTVGESFWNFSWPGPFLVFLIFGAMLKVVAGLYVQNRNNPVMLSLYVFILYRFTPGSDQLYDLIHAFVPSIVFMMFLAFPFGSVGQRGQVRRAPLVPQAPLGEARTS